MIPPDLKGRSRFAELRAFSTLDQFDPGNVFFRFVEDSNEAIMLSDKNGVLVYVNPAWCKIYGYSKDEAIGATPRLIHSGHQKPEFYQDMWSKIKDPSIGYWKGELINRAKDGTLVPVLLTITTFKTPEGEIQGYMGIAVDMTYRRELEAKVAHQDRLASIGILASGLAHEIGTPLGVVRGRAEFLLMKAENDVVRKNLEVITSQIDRISRLIRSLLRVSRSFSDVHLDEIRLLGVIQEVMGLVGQNLKEDLADIRLDIADELKVRADFGRLEQVFLNLVMNSIYAIKKAKKEGPERPHALVISAMQGSNGKTQIRVTDSGCGISPENMKKLFKPFFTTKEVGEGTGLGLAIVAQLVREMEGEISVSSELGKGSVFTITLGSA